MIIYTLFTNDKYTRGFETIQEAIDELKRQIQIRSLKLFIQLPDYEFIYEWTSPYKVFIKSRNRNDFFRFVHLLSTMDIRKITIEN